MNPLKERYNKLIEREKKAEDFISKATDEQYEKWLPEFQNIIIQLSTLIDKIEKEEGRKLTQNEALEGFKEG
jgi:flagellin-specific chaperone FliS